MKRTEIVSDSPFKDLTKEEINCLERFVRLLEEYQDRDPKYDLLKKNTY